MTSKRATLLTCTRWNRPDADSSYNLDRNAIAQYAPLYPDQVWGVSVGSETLYRGNFTGAQLVAKMTEVKNQLGGKFRIGTADSWNKFADGTADAVIQSNPDFLFVNAFGFWQGQAIANASHTYFDDLMQAYKKVESIAGTGKIDLWGGETGWPTGILLPSIPLSPRLPTNILST
jgi:glucan 1,3-beta-glucosidase